MSDTKMRVRHPRHGQVVEVDRVRADVLIARGYIRADDEVVELPEPSVPDENPEPELEPDPDPEPELDPEPVPVAAPVVKRGPGRPRKN